MLRRLRIKSRCLRDKSEDLRDCRILSKFIANEEVVMERSVFEAFSETGKKKVLTLFHVWKKIFDELAQTNGADSLQNTKHREL